VKETKKERMRVAGCNIFTNIFVVGIFTSTDIYIQAEKYFSPGEWLVGDGGYPGDGPVVIPFNSRQVSSNSDPEAARALNSTLAQWRVRVEHVFGRVKELWRIMHSQNTWRCSLSKHSICFYVCCLLTNYLHVGRGTGDA
jgi:hypothetical protein